MSGRPPENSQTVTVVIPTKNAAEELRECLPTVAWADEIIVVDMFSTDGTADVCAAFEQCTVVERSGYIHGNYNHGFDLARSDWVMRLDADERVTPELAAEIPKLTRSAPPDVVGYEFWERPVILGRELKYGFGKRHCRRMLFRRGAARYPVRSQHEQLEGKGKWLQARHGYLHYNYRRVAQYLDKTNYYTDREVEAMDTPDRPPTLRRAVTEVARAFYIYYLRSQGFRDGWVGFVDAAMRAHYQLVYWAKVRERSEGETARHRS